MAAVDISALSREELVLLLGDVLARLIAPPPSPTTTDALLSAEDLAKRWCVPETWVRDQGRSGRLKVTQIGRYVRFTEADAAAFLASDHAKGLTAPVRTVRLITSRKLAIHDG